VFVDNFDMLISKIKKKILKKNIVLMYFQLKNTYIKNITYHIIKHTLNQEYCDINHLLGGSVVRAWDQGFAPPVVANMMVTGGLHGR